MNAAMDAEDIDAGAIKVLASKVAKDEAALAPSSVAKKSYEATWKWHAVSARIW
jgi:hypothetical protein